MDYKGQRLAELIFYWIILSFGIVGWVIGYVQQDFTVVFQAWLVGVLISVLVSLSPLRPTIATVSLSHIHRYVNPSFSQLCVPDWPFYNRNPISWLESVPDRRQHAKSS